MSSLEWTAYRVTRDQLKAMARDQIFTAVGEDKIRGIDEGAVVGKFRPQASQERGSGDQGEYMLPNPGIVLSWIGHNRPVNAGENCFDDGMITMLIQVVDRLDRSLDANIESYMRWMADIREWLQANPYRDQSRNLGEIYLVHVTDYVSPDQRAYILDEARLVMTVALYTRTRRDTGVRNYDT